METTTRLLYCVLSRPLPSMITSSRKARELSRAIARTAKSVKPKYENKEIHGVKEWR